MINKKKYKLFSIVVATENDGLIFNRNINTIIIYILNLLTGKPILDLRSNLFRIFS